MTQQPPVLRIAIIGSGGVGKSALTLQFMYDEFIEDYEPTKADSYRKTEYINREEAQFDILDTAGQEDYNGIRDYYFRSSEGFLLVYSIDDEESLRALPTFYEQIVRIKNCEQPPMLIVANKYDLKGSIQKDYTVEGMHYAQCWGVPFVETSAKTCYNVEKVFMEIGRKVRQSQLASIQYPKQVQKHKRRKRCTIL
ncbi:unnamed protein product [Heterobilharzia americana]|nr:unnamed protein product [Heterobilharzia americana]